MALFESGLAVNNSSSYANSAGWCGTCSMQETGYAQHYPRGEKLFKGKCTACHKIDKKLTGPALMGITSRVPDMDWLIRFTRNSAAVIESGDPYAVALFQEYDSIQMTTFPSLTDEEIMEIYWYIDGYTPLPDNWPLVIGCE